MTMVNGVGAWVGSILSGMAVDYFSVDGVKDGKLSGWCLQDMLFSRSDIFLLGFKYNHDPEKIKHRAVALLKGFAALLFRAAFMIKVN
ncbi:hypothetical protein ACVXG9_26215 [Escherichia coli]